MKSNMYVGHNCLTLTKRAAVIISSQIGDAHVTVSMVIVVKRSVTHKYCVPEIHFEQSGYAIYFIAFHDTSWRTEPNSDVVLRFHFRK